MTDDLTLALYIAFRVAAGATGMVVLLRYYFFARRSALGLPGAVSIFFRRLALILPVAVLVWLVLSVTVESDQAFFVIDTMFPVVIALSAAALARRAVMRQPARPVTIATRR